MNLQSVKMQTKDIFNVAVTWQILVEYIFLNV